MKKRKPTALMKKMLSAVIALTMAVEAVPELVLAADKGINDKLVASLAELYNGDTERARKELEAFYEAGIIDENGDMVELDIREDGAAVTLEDIIAKIDSGEEIGDLTINGHATTQDQVEKIYAVKTALEVAKMLAQDVEITDEHVENLENLLQGISDGRIDIDSAIKSGKLTLDGDKITDTGSAQELYDGGDQTDNFPESATSNGEVETDANGKYTQPLISDDKYEASHAFELIDPNNKEYYTDKNYEGIITDGVISLSCDDTATAGGTVTVTATLDKKQSVPVSFDYAAAGGSIGASGSGTVTWAAGETGEKTFTVNVAAKGDDLWEGKRAFVINVSNVRNAVLSGNAVAWSKTVTVEAHDDNSMNRWVTIRTLPEGTSKNADTTVSEKCKGGESKDVFVSCTYSEPQTINNMSAGSPLKLVLTLSGAVPEQKHFEENGLYESWGKDIIDYNNKTTVDFELTNPNDNSKKITRTVEIPAKASSSVIELTAEEANDLIYQSSTNITATVKYYAHFQPNLVSSAVSLFNVASVIGGDCLKYYGTFAIQAPTISNVLVQAMPLAKVTGVSVPSGTYYSGQTVPVTVTLDQYAIATENAKLMVNNVECPMLEAAGTVSKKFTFAYTVKTVDTGAVNVQSISNLDGMDPGFELTPKSFDVDDNVKLISAVKQASLDMANAKYGISDGDAGEQVMTAVIPFKSDLTSDDVTWVGNENYQFTTTGIDMSVPDYGEVTIMDCLKGAYFSYDNGKTRFPVYIVRQDKTFADNKTVGEAPVALMTRFAPPMNETAYLRKDTLNLFMDMDVGISDETKYIDSWENAKEDTNGFAYFDGSAKTDSAPAFVGANYTFYTKGGVLFEEDKYISRGEADYAEKTENGWLNLDDGSHIMLVDAQNPGNQYDVEIAANDKFYQAQTHGVRAEDLDDLTLTPVFSNRKNFTFIRPEDFEWISSDEEIATVQVDENGVGHIERTGEAGEVEFTLHVKNGSQSKAYDLDAVKLTVLEGLTPFLNIPKYSQVRMTLTETATDVPFASNVTARNNQLGKDTVYTVKLYNAKLEGEQYTRDGDSVIWQQNFDSTVKNTLTHITVPADKLTKAGIYEVEITTEYYGGEVREKDTLAQNDLTAKAYLVAKQAPASVHLNKLKNYYVTADNIPTIGYTVSENVNEIEYTIQKSGESVGERKQATGGSIPFTASMPDSLKESYTITVYARNNAEDSWSVDSMRLTVYNPDILEQIVKDVTAGEIGGTTGGVGEDVGGTTIKLDNHDKVTNYLNGSDYQLTFDDFTALRTDISLQKIVSVNYGEAVYGMLSDKMKWESSDPQTVSVDYKQGGIYSDIRNYSYTSYSPATDFLLVGKKETGEDEKVTITATHANTGIQSSFDVTTTMLKDQLYVFRFLPAVKTDVIYTNGKGEKRTLSTNDNGELAVYEPDGIFEPVMARAVHEGRTYVGTLYPDDLETGECDVASLQLYPCNNLRLRVISDAELTFLTPDGKPYNGAVTIRGGAYKNGIYCPGALLSVDNNTTKLNGREDIQATVTNGKLNITLDPTQFKHDPNNTAEYGGAQPGDTITYVFEYRFGDTYAPGYVTLNAYTNIEGASSPTDSVVYMRNNTSGDTMPQIIHQNLQQFYDGTKANPYTRNVIDFTNNIGVSKRFSKAELTTDIALPGETVSHDDNGYTTYSSEDVPGFSLFNPNNHEFTGQVDNTKKTADQIIDLNDLNSSTLFVFPFSEVPVARSVYTMTDANLKKDGLTDEGKNPTISSAIKAAFTQGGMTIKTETLPFGVSNLSHQKDLSQADSGAKEVGVEVESKLKNNLSLSTIFGDIEVNDMLKKGFIYMSKLTTVAGITPIDMMILPTEDPGTFRILVNIGHNKRDIKTNTNPSIDFDPDHMYDDLKELKADRKQFNKNSGKNKNKDKENKGVSSSSVHINYYGFVILEAKVGVLGDKWGVDFVGGNVGTNFRTKYEWNLNTFVGPFPANVNFTINGDADLEVSFANKAEARALLIDAVVGVSVEAFAGLGFDISVAALKLGIFGKIEAEDNFLYLTTGNQTGNQLKITGEIGIKFVAKVSLIEYEKVLASTGFNWTKTWGKYDQIKQTWENEGYAEMTGLTTSGRRYTMMLMSNGTAMVTIDGGNQIENRDYLKSASKLKGIKLRGGITDGMTALIENAYPYANPVFNDDGSMYLYISDNNNANKPESVVHYAVKGADGYTDKGRVDTSEGNILADTDVVASGSGENTFAAWVKQMDSPEKEMKDKTTYDDLGMMMNATEIYASRYNGTNWTTEKLTDNTAADMAPTIASSGDKAIVAWRSLSATQMPKEGGSQDLTAMFNVENTINYRIYDGTQWKDAKIAYNGSAGTVNAVNAAMLSDGTSLIVYSVRTTNDVTGSETFYTLVNSDGEVVTTGRLTNDNYTDTNAQVTAVGEQFIVGWYSEHAAGEEGDADNTVVSHDIGLARIDKNGSVDASFPESIGGTAADKIGSDFHFSAPANCDDLNKLSIVWSQKKESDKNEDAGKSQLNAVRFFEEGEVIGVTSQTNIAETSKNNVIDKFDTYTESDGTVKAIIVDSDYSNIEGIDVYDSIDLTNLPIESVNDSGESSKFIDILTKEPTTSVRLASGQFAESKIDAEASTDLYDLMPGLDLPVQFTVRNTGTGKVNSVSATIGGKTENFTGLDLLPGESAIITVNYPVPEKNISDVNYTLTANGNSNAKAEGTLELNCPDVGISGIKITKESDKQRDLLITLSNMSEIPLVGSGKTVKLELYKDREHKEKIGSTITIDSSNYQDIDDDIYAYPYTLELNESLIEGDEVPEEGIRIYARAWVEDVDELYTLNNDSFVTVNGLLSKYHTQMTMDTALVKDNDGEYTVTADISNNSLQQAELGKITVDVLDKNNKVLESVDLNQDDLTLEGENTTKLTSAKLKLASAPVAVSLRSSTKSVILDAGNGSCDVIAVTLDNNNRISVDLPTATRSGYTFDGWFTEAVGGEEVTDETELKGGMTIYAHYTSIVQSQTFTVTMDSYEYDGTAHEPVIDGDVYGDLKISYYNIDTDEVLEKAPSEVGNYRITVHAAGDPLHYAIVKSVSYSITAPKGTIVVRARNAYFTGLMNLVVKFKLPDEVVKDTKAYVEYSWTEGTEKRTEKKLVSELPTGKVGDDKVYLVENPVYAPEMDNKVTYKFFSGSGKQIAMTNADGTEMFSNGYQFSLRDYLDLAMANGNDDMKALADAAYDYGIASQINFKYGDYKDLKVSDKVKAVKLSDLEQYKLTESGTLPEIIKNVKYSVEFGMDNTMRVKFNFKSAPTAEQLKSLSCTIDSKAAELEKLGDTQYALVVRNIAAPQIDTAHTFTISDGKNTYTTVRSALSYAYSAIEANTNPTLVDLAKAMYLYNQAANEKFGE